MSLNGLPPFERLTILDLFLTRFCSLPPLILTMDAVSFLVYKCI